MTVKEIIMDSIEELNEQLDDDRQLVYSEDVRLIGKKAAIDSMEFVTFITIIEERISDELDKDIRIVSDKAFSRERSPFYSFETLEEFIAELIKEVE
ncbi:MAG: hypothetical protein K2L07_04075 [Lachnospiraceae bacterium]|nr:hypothetical protein [Lachnospiraceae bacterium]